MLIRVFALLLFFTFGSPLFADVAGFEFGPNRVRSAWNAYRGSFSTSIHSRFYNAQDVFIGPNNIESGVVVWDSQTSLELHFGLLDHFGISVAPIVVQSNHQDGGSTDIPGDLLLHAKVGSIGAAAAKTKMALQFDLRFPLGATHDIPLNPYSAAAIGYGGTALLSWNSNPEQPRRGLQWDVNLSYFNHNDADLALNHFPEDTTLLATSTQELAFGTALHWRGKKFDFFTDFYGAYFLQSPPLGAYSRENSFYIAPGFKYQFNQYIQVQAGIDLLLIGGEDETGYERDDDILVPKPFSTLPNYPDWRFNFALCFQLAQGSPPVIREKKEKTDVRQIAGTVTGSDKNRKKSKKEKEAEIRDLEKRLRNKSKKKVGETEEQRRERMQREREKMEALLKKLREDLKKGIEEK